MYVELKTGYDDNGPAWIRKAFFSKTGKTIYFDGKVFLKGERHIKLVRIYNPGPKSGGFAIRMGDSLIRFI